MPDLGAKDKVRAAFLEASKKLPDGEREVLDKLAFEMTERGRHRDDMAISVVFRQKSCGRPDSSYPALTGGAVVWCDTGDARLRGD